MNCQKAASNFDPIALYNSLMHGSSDGSRKGNSDSDSGNVANKTSSTNNMDSQLSIDDGDDVSFKDDLSDCINELVADPDPNPISDSLFNDPKLDADTFQGPLRAVDPLEGGAPSSNVNHQVHPTSIVNVPSFTNNSFRVWTAPVPAFAPSNTSSLPPIEQLKAAYGIGLYQNPISVQRQPPQQLSIMFQRIPQSSENFGQLTSTTTHQPPKKQQNDCGLSLKRNAVSHDQDLRNVARGSSCRNGPRRSSTDLQVAKGLRKSPPQMATGKSWQELSSQICRFAQETSSDAGWDCYPKKKEIVDETFLNLSIQQPQAFTNAKKAFKKSIKTQSALVIWDKEMGNKRCHSGTMTKTNLSRKKLLQTMKEIELQQKKVRHALEQHAVGATFT